jgi:hypothetical protein
MIQRFKVYVPLIDLIESPMMLYFGKFESNHHNTVSVVLKLENSHKEATSFQKSSEQHAPKMDNVMTQSSTFLFLEAFANLVTKQSSRPYQWLARSGSYSIYALLSQIVPKVQPEAVK